MNVLVIDDDDLVRLVIVEILEAQGFKVWDLPSPIGATKICVDNSIDVVSVDVQMPSMSGDKLSVLLRKNPRLKDIGIVLMSGMGHDELERIRVESGADEMVEKEDMHTSLVRAVRRSVRFRKK